VVKETDMQNQKTKITRKSKAIRLSQAEKLKTLYEQTGHIHSSSYRFIFDMVLRLKRRDITSGQKRYLDSLIEQGEPKIENPLNPDEVAALEAAMSVEGMETHKEALQSFRHKLSKGYDLSERQINFMNILLEKAEDFRVNGKFVPTEKDIKILVVAEAAAKGKNSWYWSHRQGQAQTIRKAADWLSWQRSKAEGVELGPEPEMSQWLVDKAASSCKGALKEMLSPRHIPGDMRFRRWHSGPNIPCMIIGEPIVGNEGKVQYDCLIDGEVQSINAEDILKR
jgi:hypothetical protein